MRGEHDSCPASGSPCHSRRPCLPRTRGHPSESTVIRARRPGTSAISLENVSTAAPFMTLPLGRNARSSDSTGRFTSARSGRSGGDDPDSVCCLSKFMCHPFLLVDLVSCTSIWRSPDETSCSWSMSPSTMSRMPGMLVQSPLEELEEPGAGLRQQPRLEPRVKAHHLLVEGCALGRRQGIEQRWIIGDVLETHLGVLHPYGPPVPITSTRL